MHVQSSDKLATMRSVLIAIKLEREAGVAWDDLQVQYSLEVHLPRSTERPQN